MRLRPLPIVLSLALAAGLVAEETAPATTGEPPVAGVATVEPAGALKSALPDAPSLVEREGGLWWDDGKGSAYHVVAVDDKGQATLDTEVGPVAVPRKLLAENRVDALGALPKLVAQAQAGQAKGPAFALAEGIMTGIHLRSPEVLVLPEGVLRKAPVMPLDRAGDTKRLEELVAATRKALAEAPYDALGRKSVADILRRLPLADDAETFEVDEVLPSFARRVVRGGWLAGVFKGDPLVGRFDAILDAAEKVEPVSLFEGAGLRLAEVKNAFGEGGWVLSTPNRTSYARPHPLPMYAWNAKELNLTVVVDLPAGADPMVDGAKAVGARLFQGGKAIAGWTRDGGFACDEARWRLAVPDHGDRVDENAVKGFLPPHLVIADLDGDLHLLVTRHGVLAPPRDGGATEAERFLKDAAKSLPDAAHLDLVGEHLFYYVYDSPDTRHPTLIGNKLVKGDIHQTAQQTLATTTGGICRGDCDDLSELYQAITEHQGRTAHIITLPSHAALAFAEQRDDGWHTFILQTGQPREFTAQTLPESLRKAYLSFDESDNFDPNGLGLLLRFSGENTRGPWRLSWRIFAEPAYAETMIDVQKDWHFSTYQRGIHKMLELIKGGDDDTANYRELSGLYSFTGQYPLAVEYHGKALERTAEPESRLYATVELIGHLFEAERGLEARALATTLLDEQLPALQEELGQRTMQLGFQLANVLINGESYELAGRVVAETLLDELSKQIESVGQWLASPQFNARRWEAAEQLRRMQQMYVGTALQLLEGAGPDALPADETLQRMVSDAQSWLNRVAFHDVDEDEDVLARYASAGSFYAALLGEERLLAMLDAAKLPEPGDERAHAKRVGGLAQVGLDLPWIKLSVPFWLGRLERRFARKEETLDKPAAIAAGARLAEAYARAEELGLAAPFLDYQAHIGGVITALIAEDEPALRARLRHVKEKDDKRLRDDTAQWLGDCARFLPMEWYGKVLAAWVEELDYKPKYFWIAWRAALNKAPEHALAVAKLAAERFADDPAFAEEYAFMRTVLEQPAAKDRTDAPAPQPVVIETHD
jgi:hypothetical protein